MINILSFSSTFIDAITYGRFFFVFNFDDDDTIVIDEFFTWKNFWSNKNILKLIFHWWKTSFVWLRCQSSFEIVLFRSKFSFNAKSKTIIDCTSCKWFSFVRIIKLIFAVIAFKINFVFEKSLNWSFDWKCVFNLNRQI